jgi:hypothetical protein
MKFHQTNQRAFCHSCMKIGLYFSVELFGKTSDPGTVYKLDAIACSQWSGITKLHYLSLLSKLSGDASSRG